MPNSLKDFLAKDTSAAAYVSMLENYSIRDSLTGLYNFRFFQDQLPRAISGTQRMKGSICMVIDDLDDFGAVNKMYGKHVGDEVLRRVANVKQKGVRPSDSVYRIGGEEGAVILPSTDIKGAVKIAKVLREKIGQLDMTKEVRRDLDTYARKTRSETEEMRYQELETVLATLSRNPGLAVTVSQGIGVYPDTRVINAGGLISETDRAMRLAKRNGKNQACTIYDTQTEK